MSTFPKPKNPYKLSILNFTTSLHNDLSAKEEWKWLATMSFDTWIQKALLSEDSETHHFTIYKRYLELSECLKN